MSRFISYSRSAPDFFPPNKKSHRKGLYGGKPKLLYSSIWGAPDFRYPPSLKFAIKRLRLTLYGENQDYFGLPDCVECFSLAPNLLYFNVVAAGEKNQVMRYSGTPHLAGPCKSDVVYHPPSLA